MKGVSRTDTNSGEIGTSPDSMERDEDIGQTASPDYFGSDIEAPATEDQIQVADRAQTADDIDALELLASDSYSFLRFYERTLDPHGTPKEKAEIPKEVLPALPDRFERTRLAKRPENSLSSYRDMNASVHSSHIHEYPDHWELHVDCFNPHYRPVEHALVDTGISGQAWDTVTALLVGTLATLTVTRDLTLESSRLGDLEFGSMATSLVDAALTGLSAGVDLLTLV
jgi:hypothetical protein